MIISARRLAISFTLILIILITGCGSSDVAKSDTETPTGTAMPILKGVSLESAEQIVLNNEWIPRIFKESSLTIPEGQVTRTDPTDGILLEPNASVSIYVSTGPAVIFSKDATLEWKSISNEVSDTWNFETPFISNEILNINLVNVALTQNVKWKDSNVYGMGFGRASITDTFDKTVPVRFFCGKCKFDDKELQNLDLEIPLGDLDVSQPTQIYVELYEENIVIELNFNITW